VPCEAVTSSGSLLANIFHILQLQQTSQEDALTTLYKFLISTPPCLLVLDNFETPWDESKDQRAVKTILQKIAAVNDVTLIITMCGTASPLGVSWTPPSTLPVLSPLSLEGAQSVFHAITGKSEPKHEIDLLLMELDCVPLAVVLLTQLAKYQSVSSLLQQWRTHKTGLLHDQGPNSDHLTSIEVSISLSLKSPSMTMQGPDAVQLLALISHLPDGVLKWEERLENLTTLKNIPQIVGTLTKVALAYIDMSGTLKVLSPVRQYMLNKEMVEFDHIGVLEKWYINFIDQYSKTTFGPTFRDAAQNVIAEIGNITSVLKYALHTHPSQNIVYAAVNISEFLCRVQPSEEILQEIFPVLEKLHMEENKPYSTWLLGDILYWQFKYNEAREKIQDALAQYTGIGDQQGRAECLQSLGNILRMEHKYSEAREKLEDALAQYTANGYQQGRAQCLWSLGEILHAEHKHSEAIEKLEDALAQFTANGDQLGRADCLCSLGNILRMEHKYSEAREILEDALALYTANGHQQGRAECLLSLGEILRMEHKYSEARETLEEALALYTAKGHEGGRMCCLQSLQKVETSLQSTHWD
jgi:tetratricopeptide (TPR) repeat protein